MDRRVIASGGADPPGEGRRAWPGPRSRSSTPRPPRPARPLRAADLGRQAASMRLPDARVLTCTIPRYVGRPCAVVRQGARRAVMLGASQAPGNAAGGRARPPCGSRFPPPRGVGNALRCQGIAVTPPTAEETGNAILRAVESCKGVLASRYTPFLACRPISAVPHLSMGRVEEGRGGLYRIGITPFPFPAHQTGRANFPHPAFRLASSRGTRRGAKMNPAQPKHAEIPEHGPSRDRVVPRDGTL